MNKYSIKYLRRIYQAACGKSRHSARPDVSVAHLRGILDALTCDALYPQA